LISLWRKEFLKGGIPSYIRLKPSLAVRRLVRFLGHTKNLKLSGIDLGCGTGSNSLYLAELNCHMLALDFVAEQIQEINYKST
jgi:2-polyprenyl-3-methyl-5-hydroxy-6-metoxy-1,4-benzoquinol methylase